MSYRTWQEYQVHPKYLATKEEVRIRSKGVCEHVPVNGTRCTGSIADVIHIRFCKFFQFDPPENLLAVCTKCKAFLTTCRSCSSRLVAKHVKAGYVYCDQCRCTECSLQAVNKQTLRCNVHNTVQPKETKTNYSAMEDNPFQTLAVQPASSTAQSMGVLPPVVQQPTLTTYKNYEEYLQTAEWKGVKERVTKRANGMCEEILANGCRCTKPVEHVHHAVYMPWHQAFIDPPENLVALCNHCHMLRHTCIECKRPSTVRSAEIKAGYKLCMACRQKYQKLN